jgi:NADH dehydrogenase
MGVQIDAQGRIIVEPDLSLKDFPHVFVAGDQAHCAHQSGAPLPGLASVALQQGRYIGETILKIIADKPHNNFHYRDKGKMATIGKSRAIAESGAFKFTGLIAWLMWLLVHIYYLNGFKNRLMVFIQWIWSYITYDKGARLIVRREWRSYPPS